MKPIVAFFFLLMKPGGFGIRKDLSPSETGPAASMMNRLIFKVIFKRRSFGRSAEFDFGMPSADAT